MKAERTVGRCDGHAAIAPTAAVCDGQRGRRVVRIKVMAARVWRGHRYGRTVVVLLTCNAGCLNSLMGQHL